MRAWLTRAPIGAEDVLREVGGPADGATVLFLGHVRQENDGRPVSGMRYDAYLEMAERVLTEMAERAARQLGSDHVAVVHRIGELDVGEVSVAIAVSSPHRADAFQLCRALIEEIKARLPVWKHEHYRDGDVAWLPGRTAEAAGE